jgi:hypothetical protein
MEGLGRLFDLSAGIAPVDLQSAATGKLVSLKDASGVSIVVFKGAGTAGDDQTWTLKEHAGTADSTGQNLAVIGHYYAKEETTLDGDETWTRVSNLSGGNPQATILDATDAEIQQILVIEVNASSLSDGYTHVSLSNDGAGSNAQLGGVLYVLHDLAAQRAPASLPAPQ